MDYFNREERKRQKAFASVRDKLFNPVVKLLLWVGATPNQISAIGVAFLIFTCLLPTSYVSWAVVCMAFYVLCDGIDGPLARRQGIDHDGGGLVDFIADHLGVVFLPAAAIFQVGAWGPAMVLFACFYLMFIGLVVYANGLGVAVRKFIRTKYLFFLLYLASLYFERDLVTYFCAACAVYYMAESAEAVRRLYNYHAIKHGQAEGVGAEAK